MKLRHDIPYQRIVITIDFIDEPGTDTLAAAAFLDVLNHLEHDSIRPHRSTLKITTPTTP
jgi:hypothetical protein